MSLYTDFQIISGFRCRCLMLKLILSGHTCIIEFNNILYLFRVVLIVFGALLAMSVYLELKLLVVQESIVLEET